MAVMGSSDRVAVGAALQSDLSLQREAIGILKADVQAAIVAADSWADTNASSFNSALPVAARTGLTAAQKARLLMYVIRRRYETGA